MDTIKAGEFVELIYEVFVLDHDGSKTSMMKFTPERPDAFVYGKEPGMLEEFSKRLQGLKEGDTFDMTLAPEQAFGEHKDEYVMHIDKSVFEVDGVFDEKQIYQGNVVPMMTEDGYRVQGIVLGVTDEKVSMDFNHPLAGETVQYVGSVKTVRDATPEELQPQHHACSCGCDHDHCEDGDCHGCH